MLCALLFRLVFSSISLATAFFHKFRMAELYHCPDQTKIQNLKDVANKLRILSIKCTNAAGSGYVSIYISYVLPGLYLIKKTI